MSFFNLLIYSGIFFLFLYLMKRYLDCPTAENKKSMVGKVIVITGCSSGFGINTAEELLKLGAKVIMANRNEEKSMNVIKSFDENLRSQCEVIKLNLSSLKSIENFVAEFKKKIGKLDILINNAGTWEDNFSKTENGIEQTLQANVLSEILLSLHLLDSFNPEGRIINLSSVGHTYAKLDMKILNDDLNFNHLATSFDGNMEYFKSKLGNVYFTQALRNYIVKKDLNLTTVAAHPGAVNTDLSRSFRGYKKVLIILLNPLIKYLFRTPLAGAQTTLFCTFLNHNEVQNGGYYADAGIFAPGGLGNNSELRKQYMDYCKNVLKHHYNSFPSNFDDFFNC